MSNIWKEIAIDWYAVLDDDSNRQLIKKNYQDDMNEASVAVNYYSKSIFDDDNEDELDW